MEGEEVEMEMEEMIGEGEVIEKGTGTTTAEDKRM